MSSTYNDRIAGFSTSTAIKAPVKAISTANLTLSGEQTVGGVAVVNGDRVLVKNQTNTIDNGIWKVSTGEWTRAEDFNGNRDVRSGTMVLGPPVSGESGAMWQLVSPDPIVFGTSPILFDEFTTSTTIVDPGDPPDPTNPYPLSQEESDAGITEVDTTIPYGWVTRYGAVADGTWARAGTPTSGGGTADDLAVIGGTDNLAAFNAAASVFDHYNIVIPPGSYRLSEMWRVTCPLNTRGKIDGYGAELLTDLTETRAAVQFWQNTDPHGITVYGITVNHRGNRSAVAGFEIVGTAHLRMVDCVVEADNTNASYAAFRAKQLVEGALNTTGTAYVSLAALQAAHATGSFGDAYYVGPFGTAPDEYYKLYCWSIASESWEYLGGVPYDTGPFWTVFDNCSVRERSGGDPGIITTGIEFRGAANASHVRGGSIVSCTTGVLLRTIDDDRVSTDDGNGNYIANAVLLDGVAFETVTDCIRVDHNTIKAIDGLRIVNCRAESATRFLYLQSCVFQPRIPVYMFGNYVTTNVTKYIENTSNLDVCTYDVNGVDWAGYPPMQPTIVAPYATHLRCKTSNEHGLLVTPGGGQRGIQLNNADGIEFGSGAKVGQWIWSGVDTGSIFKGESKDLQIQELEALYFGSTSDVQISSGTGSPEGVVAAPPGSVYLRNNGSTGTSVYIKEAGTSNTGWSAIASGGGASPANPSATVGTSAVNGSAATYMRSDAAPAINTGMSPTWTGAHTFNTQPVTINASMNVGVGGKVAYLASTSAATVNGWSIADYGLTFGTQHTGWGGAGLSVQGYYGIMLATNRANRLEIDSTGHVSVAQTFSVGGASSAGSAGTIRLGTTTATTVGAAGAASALPATPSGYLKVGINGTLYQIPYYAVA